MAPSHTKLGPRILRQAIDSVVGLSFGKPHALGLLVSFSVQERDAEQNLYCDWFAVSFGWMKDPFTQCIK